MRVIHAQVQPGTTGRTLTARLKLLRPTSADLLDAGFLAAACLLALAGFVTGFDNLRFLAVAGAGVVLGIAAAHVVNVFRWSWAVVVLIVAALYFVLGPALTVPRLALAGVLPTPSALGALGSVLVTGWMEFLTTLPPVDPDGDLVALPWALGLLAGGLGQCAARLARSAWTPLIVPFALLCLVIALGTLDAPLLRAQGLGFAVLALGWLALRFPRTQRLLGSGRPGRLQLGLGAAMVLAALLGGLALAPVLPGVADERKVLRTEVEPPVDIRQYPTPLAGFRTFSGQDLRLYWDTPLLKVAGVEPGAQLRIAVLDRWSGSSWSGLGDDAADGTGFQRLGARVPNPPVDGVTQARVRVLPGYADNPALNPWLPSLGEVSAIAFDGPGAQEHRDNYRFNLATDQGFAPDRLRADDLVVVDSAPLPGYGSVSGDPAPGDGVRPDDTLTAFLAGTTQRLAAGDAEPWAQLAEVAKALRTDGAWSDGTRAGEEQYLPGHGQYRLNSFVTGQQFVGSDEQYAAAFALMAGRLGYPARVVFGAEVPAGGEVRGKDVRAWVELSVAGYGWVSVPTSVFTPDRSKKPEQNQRQNNDQESVRNVPPPNPVPPPGSYDEMTDTDPASARAELPASEQFWRAFWAVVRTVGPPVGLLALIVGTILGMKALRSRGRRTRGAESTRIAGGWAEVLDAARDAGRPVPSGSTRLEAAAALGRDDVRELARAADASVFGAGEISPATVTEYWTGVTGVRRALVRDLPWWRRPLARLNLASLLRKR